MQEALRYQTGVYRHCELGLKPIPRFLGPVFYVVIPRAYRLPKGEKRACTLHRPTVYGKIQTWKQDVLYLATCVLSDPHARTAEATSNILFLALI